MKHYAALVAALLALGLSMFNLTQRYPSHLGQAQSACRAYFESFSKDKWTNVQLTREEAVRLCVTRVLAGTWRG